MTEEEAKEKEREKMEKARKKREEREQIEMEVENDYSGSDDMEVCNAPSTRKSRSQPISDNKSPFHGDTLVSFSDTSIPDIQKSPVEELEVPTKSAQLERDLRSMKDDLEAQRNYLQRIDPKELPNIFKSSIETDEVLKITKAFNNGSKKWKNDNAPYLVNFLYHLTKVDRFDMAIEFCTDEEKEDTYKLINNLENSIELIKENEDLDGEEETADDLEVKLQVVSEAFK